MKNHQSQFKKGNRTCCDFEWSDQTNTTIKQQNNENNSCWNGTCWTAQ